MTTLWAAHLEQVVALHDERPVIRAEARIVDVAGYDELPARTV